jgi:hypothetical protein
MNWIVTVYTGLLFFILSQKILVSIPQKGNKYMVALFHAIIFALVLRVTHHFFYNLLAIYEGNSPITYTANAETKNPNGPPSVDVCNYPNKGGVNATGQICYHDDNSQTYYFDYSCTKSNVGVKNRNGKICTAQTDNANISTYNFV